MTRAYLVVYEKCAMNWSAFSLDIPGCGSLGDSIEETRKNMQEAVELYLAETARAGEPIPEASATSVNFEEFDHEREAQYFVEWLQVRLPDTRMNKPATQAA